MSFLVTLSGSSKWWCLNPVCLLIELYFLFFSKDMHYERFSPG